MSLRHTLALAAALMAAGASQATTLTYSYSAKGLGAAAGGTLSGTFKVDTTAPDDDPLPDRGVYNTGVTLSGSVVGGVQDGKGFQNEAKRLFVDAADDHLFTWISGIDPWPVFQLDFDALPGVDAFQGDGIPLIYLQDFQQSHHIRFQMPGEKLQLTYEITAWASTALPPRDDLPPGGGQVPLPDSASLALAGLLGVGGLGVRRRRAAR